MATEGYPFKRATKSCVVQKIGRGGPTLPPVVVELFMLSQSRISSGLQRLTGHNLCDDHPNAR